MSIHAAYVVDSTTGQEVPVELHDELSPGVLLDIETQWSSVRTELRRKLDAANVPRAQQPQSLHWDWGEKSLLLSLFKKPDSFRVFALRRQAAWEGAMVTLRGEVLTRLAPDCGKPLIYVDYVEAAPWNWTVKEAQQVRKYKAVGAVLLRAAVAQSQAESFDGRIGLHALPQADHFYQGQGLQLVDFDAPKRMNYFELTAEAVQHFERG